MALDLGALIVEVKVEFAHGRDGAESGIQPVKLLLMYPIEGVMEGGEAIREGEALKPSPRDSIAEEAEHFAADAVFDGALDDQQQHAICSLGVAQSAHSALCEQEQQGNDE